MRIDFARGAALLIVFSDHVAGNTLRHATPGAFGFSDMAEVFVFLSGYVCGEVYGRRLSGEGFRACQAKAFLRGGQIYLANLAMLAVALPWIGCRNRNLRPDGICGSIVYPGVLGGPLAGVLDVLTLRVQLMQFAVLPLYLALLLALPVMLLIFRQRPSLMVGVSLALYAAVQAWPETFRLPAPWRSAWHFNPLAWQVVFFLGAAVGAGGPGVRRLLPRGPIATMVAALGLEGAFLARSFAPDMICWAGKPDLEPLRLAHFACLLVVGRALLPTSERFEASRLARPLILCGQSSLPVYCAGGLLAIEGGRIVLTNSGDPVWQVFVNVLGWIGCVAVAAAWQRSVCRRRRFLRAGRPEPSTGHGDTLGKL